MQDLGLGVRTLSRAPAFTGFACLILALGIGATTTVFSVFNALLFRPLPYPDPERVVSIVRAEALGVGHIHDQQTVAFLRERADSFVALTGLGVSPGLNLSSDHGTTHVNNLEVTAGYFQVLSIQPLLGRGFTLDDELTPNTVVLSHELWVRHFEQNPDVVGQGIRLGGTVHTVIGVTPAGLWTFERPDAWTPFRPDPSGSDRNYRLMGRLAPGRTTSEASAELSVLAAELRIDHPSAVRDRERLVAQAHQATLATGTLPVMWLLAAAVLMVLLVVCANTAGLQLARGAGRSRELAVRAALGGGPGRLIRQLLTESLIIALAGGSVGVLAAHATIPALGRLQPVMATWDVAIDGRVLLAALCLSVGTGLVFGVLPAWRATRSDPSTALQQAVRAVRHRLRRHGCVASSS